MIPKTLFFCKRFPQKKSIGMPIIPAFRHKNPYIGKPKTSIQMTRCPHTLHARSNETVGTQRFQAVYRQPVLLDAVYRIAIFLGYTFPHHVTAERTPVAFQTTAGHEPVRHHVQGEAVEHQVWHDDLSIGYRAGNHNPVQRHPVLLTDESIQTHEGIIPL